MKRVALGFVVVTACTGGDNAMGPCPPGQTCSPLTPNGLYFIGAAIDGAELVDGVPTAVGGTQPIQLALVDADGGSAAFDLPYRAEVGSGGGVAVASTAGSVVTLRGI